MGPGDTVGFFYLEDWRIIPVSNHHLEGKQPHLEDLPTMV